MTATHTLRRMVTIGLAGLAIAFALTSTASAATSSIPDDVVVVSSTQLGSGSFTMTATNVSANALDLDLAAPGDVSTVSVDSGSFDGRWLLILDAGATGTMTGLLAQ